MEKIYNELVGKMEKDRTEAESNFMFYMSEMYHYGDIEYDANDGTVICNHLKNAEEAFERVMEERR